MRVPISACSLQHFLSFFFIRAALVSRKCHHTGVWVCISLMANKVEYLFTSSLEKYLFRSFCPFLIQLFVLLLLSCESYSVFFQVDKSCNSWHGWFHLMTECISLLPASHLLPTIHFPARSPSIYKQGSLW